MLQEVGSEEGADDDDLEDDELDGDDEPRPDPALLARMMETLRTQQPVVVAPKPGRNDPCTCGSGKKYKKCCGA